MLRTIINPREHELHVLEKIAEETIRVVGGNGDQAELVQKMLDAACVITWEHPHDYFSGIVINTKSDQYFLYVDGEPLYGGDIAEDACGTLGVDKSVGMAAGLLLFGLINREQALKLSGTDEDTFQEVYENNWQEAAVRYAVDGLSALGKVIWP